MCGIVGIYSNKNSVSSEMIVKMKKTLTHRGPDDSGYHINRFRNIALGHTRLSIIDLSKKGSQPMSNDGKDIWISFNGEIYNYRQIRDELRGLGVNFQSSSDTEVVIKSYEKWGIGCLEKFIGMFAIAILDERNETLFLVRDRMGVKPLYYYTNDGLILFGSELRAIQQHPEFRKELNIESVPKFIKYGYIPCPDTIYKNTFKLSPGHYLEINNNGITDNKYWDISDCYLKENINLSEPEIEERMEALLIDSFKLRMVSDVPVGVFLSSGIDSGILTTLLQNHTSEKIKTFTIGFYDQKKNEAVEAKKLAEFLETDHHEHYFSENEAIDLILKLPEIFDEPFGDTSSLPTYLVSKIAVNDVKVALSADGGDELFGGYNRYIRTLQIFNSPPAINFLKYQATRFSSVFSPVRRMNRYLGLNLSLNEYKNITNNDLSSLWENSMSYCDSNKLSKLMLDSSAVQNMNIFDRFFDERYDNLDICSKLLMADSRTYLPDYILTKVDRCSMSVSLEAREPFLDHRLIEFTTALPTEYKIRGTTSKYILRKILRKYIPESLIIKKKKGFGMPITKWLKTGDFKPTVNEYLNPERLRTDGIFNPVEIQKLLSLFYRGKNEMGQAIWNLLMFQMWKERWF